MECPKLAISISKDEIIKTNVALSERAKKLPKARVRKTVVVLMVYPVTVYRKIRFRHYVVAFAKTALQR